MARRHGFTLVETLIVVVVIGLAALIALPKLNAAFTQSTLTSAKGRVMSMYSAARATAVSNGQTGVLRVNGNQVYVYAWPRRKLPLGVNTLDTIVKPVDLSAAFGVTLGGGVDSVRIAPTGLGRDSAVIVLTKSGHLDTLIISKYGRVLQ